VWHKFSLFIDKAEAKLMIDAFGEKWGLATTNGCRDKKNRRTKSGGKAAEYVEKWEIYNEMREDRN